MAILNVLKRAVAGKKVILLDLDNTLYAYDPCHTSAQKETHRFYCRHVHKITFSDYQKKYTRAQNVIHRKLRGTAFCHSRLYYFQVMLQKERVTFSAAKLEKAYWNAFFKKMKLEPWVLPFLTFCKKEKKKVVIVTNLTTVLQKQKLKILNLTKRVDGVVTSEDAGIEKPHPRIFRLALKKARVKPSDAITVGDDLKTDRAGFLDFFWVRIRR